MMTFNSDTYKRRRDILRQKMGTGQLLILGNDESSMNYKDNCYRFVQDSTFIYYFGINQPGLSAIINANGDDVVFGHELSIDDIIWTGPLPTLKERAERVGVRTVKKPDELSSSIGKKTFFLPPYRPEHQIKLSRLINKPIEQLEALISLDLLLTISAQRSIKTEEEIDQMHEACTFSGEAHRALMTSAHPGMREHHLVGIFENIGMDHNVHTSYPTICTINGQTLHNHYYNNELADGKLVLVDGGLHSKGGYAGDLTRTFPVSKSFTTKQKDIYNVVYEGFIHAINIARPEMLFRDLHLRTAVKLAEGLISLGLMKGNAEEAVADGAHTLFFPHGLGHLIGLDVHDLENFGEEHIGYFPDLKKSKEFGLKSLRLGKAMQKGYTVTIEPGIYFIPELMNKKEAEGLHKEFINYDKVYEYQDFGGIRLEDNFVMREYGFEKLGEYLARTVDEVEELRAEAYG
ncbi:MAG: aminopeptidase P family protein [Saprospiraceae bacterium]